MSALVYLLAIIGTNAAFAALGPAPLTFVIAGVALVARDFVHERYGRRLALALVVLGAVASVLLASPAVALASGVAFGIAETLDLAVYDRLRSRSQALGVLASGVVGAAVDSLIFLWIALGSLALFPAQLTGKVLASLAGAAMLAGLHYWRRVRA